MRVRQTYWSPIGWLDKLTTIYLPWDSLALVGAAAIIGWGNKLFSILLLVVKSLSCGTTLILLFSWLNNYLDYLSIGSNSVSFSLAIYTVKDCYLSVVMGRERRGLAGRPAWGRAACLQNVQCSTLCPFALWLIKAPTPCCSLPENTRWGRPACNSAKIFWKFCEVLLMQNFQILNMGWLKLKHDYAR